MKKIFILLFTCFLFNTLIAQEKISEQKLKLKFHKIKTNLISNEITNNLLAIVVDKKNIHLQLMDDKFTVIQEVSTEKPKLNSLGYINYYYEEGVYHLYFSNNFYRNKSVFSSKENSIFHVVSYDTANKSVVKKEFSIPNPRERYLSSFNRNGKLCMMFIEKKTSKFHFYTFEKENILEDKVVSLEDYSFRTLANQSFYKAITNPMDKIVLESTIYFETITDDYSTIMDQINSKMKLYPFEDEIILTVDIRKFATRIFTFSLDDLSFEYKEIKHQKTICDDEPLLIDSNSFLLDGKLFQVSNCKKETSLAIYDLKKEKFIKTFQAKKEDGISYKNSPFMQEGGLNFFTSDDHKEVSNNTAFKRMAKGNIAIFPLVRGNQIELTIGSYLEVQYTSAPAASFSNMAAPMGFTHSATYSRGIAFRSLINKNTFEHEKGKTEKNAFDKINYLKKRYDSDIETSSISGKCILKYKDYFILSYCLKSEDIFVMWKFM